MGLRELYSLVMLDVAWGLFELRMLRAPTTDPNVLWTEIASRYLGVAPILNSRGGPCVRSSRRTRAT